MEKLGLSGKETRIYLASLDLGDSSFSEIAKKANIPRTSCYNIVELLVSKGFLNVFQMGSRHLYRAENPDKFLISLREQEAALREIMPQLKSRHKSSGGKPTIYFHEGVQGINNILEDILARQRPLLAITSIDAAIDVLGHGLADFIQRRYKKHLRVKLLTHQSEKTLKLKRRDGLELRQTKFLPHDFQFKTANFIYGNRIAMIDFQKKNPFGLIIEDENITETQRMLFESIWEQTRS